MAQKSRYAGSRNQKIGGQMEINKLGIKVSHGSTFEIEKKQEYIEGNPSKFYIYLSGYLTPSEWQEVKPIIDKAFETGKLND